MRWRTSATIIFSVMGLLTMGCGTRVVSEEGSPAQAKPAAATPVTGDATVPAAPPSAHDVGSATGPAASAGSVAPAVDPKGNTGPQAPAARSNGGSPVVPEGRPKTVATPPGSSTGSPAPGNSADVGSSPGPPAPTKASPVVLASIGTYSGPIGTVLAPMVQATQAWVNVINARGGLNGHAAQLIVYDDGGDPAKSRAQAQEAVEKRRAIAFVQMGQPVTGQCCVEYITAKRIPVIGSESGSPWFYDTSPMYFPQIGSGELLTLSAIYSAAQEAIPAGKTKLGFLSCTEATTCSDLPDRVWSKAAPKLGFQVVYKGRSSLAQPDFTAECLAAQNQGTQVMLIALDSNTVGRVAASCARQGFKPLFAIPGGVVAERMKDDPNLAGIVGSTNAFPWFQTGTPATDEFQQVMKAQGKGIARGVGAANGWVTGKLLERATKNLPEPPTSDAILQGLWSIRADDLGGLTDPLTFVENKPAHATRICLWTIRVDKGAWVSVDGFRRNCHDLG